MPIILTYGDSNTHGTAPMAHRKDRRRFGIGTRWTTVMAGALGPDWHLVEEGLPGRTTQHDDPAMWPNMNGHVGLRMALASHGPLDVLTIMLGTNDLKTRFAPTPQQITAGAAGLLDIALSLDMQEAYGPFKILLICPPPVIETGSLQTEFWGGTTPGQSLGPAYAALAHSRGVGFFDSGSIITSSPVDGVHFDEAAHKTLGIAVAKVVTTL